MGTRFGYAVWLFMLSLVLVSLAQDPLFDGTFPARIEKDLSEVRLRENVAYAQGVVVREINRWPQEGKRWFEVEYRVNGIPYYASVSTSDKDLAQLYEWEAISIKTIDGITPRDPIAPYVAILYDRTDPSRHIVGEFAGAAPLSLGNIPISLILYIGLMAFIIFEIAYIIFRLITISYVLNNGKRVLAELTALKWGRYPEICSVKCKWAEEPFKVFKGRSVFRIDLLMQENNIKYIPMYILPQHRNIYYINCDELKKITQQGTYNGRRVDELKETDRDMVMPERPWFFIYAYRPIIWTERE